MTSSKILCLLVIAVLGSLTMALNNGLGQTPAMGWNSWNKYACNVNEQIIKNTADAIVAAGLDKLGYKYVNIDDCWSSGRDSQKRLIADPTSFPSGIKVLADYIHNKGLKIGIYSDAGTNTCAGRPGSLFYEKIDAQTFADWGIDYLKYDNCHDTGLSPRWRYPRMRDALNQTGRPIFFSMCEWGVDNPATWAQSVGNSWRTTGDISANWGSVTSIIDQQASISHLGGIGAWNDPDMLEVGNGDLTFNESVSHFAMWAIMKAPLILGNDITNLDLNTRSIITNNEIILLNQDPLGVPAVRVYQNADGFEIWACPLVGNAVGVVVLNRGATSTNSIEVDFTTVGFKNGRGLVRDLYAYKDIATVDNAIVLANTLSHGVRVLKISPAA